MRLSIKRGGDSVEKAITTDASLVAAQDSDTEFGPKNHGNAYCLTNVFFLRHDTGGSLRRQDTMRGTPAQTRSERKAKEKGVAIIDVEDFSRIVRPVRSITTHQPLPTIDPKDKGKCVLVEEEPMKIKMRDQCDLQVQADVELAQRLHEEELAELERAQQERQRQEDDTNSALDKEFAQIGDEKRMKFGEYSNQMDWTLISLVYCLKVVSLHTLLMDGTLTSFNMLVEKRYPLIKEMLQKMLNWKLEAWKLERHNGIEFSSFQVTSENEEVFGYILLVIKMLILKKLDD
ncbi:hypothetical protein Tco_0287270 [Tanacetum coccineum]